MKVYMIGMELPDELVEKVREYKDEVFDICGEQQQLRDVPHSTLVVNSFFDSVEGVLEEIVKDFRSFEVYVGTIGIFPPEHVGSYMVHAMIEKSEVLENLQERIVVETSRFREGSLLRTYLERNVPDYNYDSEELKNFEMYGFPYVGKNWKPHITIGILDKVCFDKVESLVMEKDLSYRFLLKGINLYEYGEDGWRIKRKFGFLR